MRSLFAGDCRARRGGSSTAQHPEDDGPMRRRATINTSTAWARGADLARGSTLSAKFMATAQGTIHAWQSARGVVWSWPRSCMAGASPAPRGWACCRPVSPTFEELSAFFRMVTGRVLAAYATPGS